MPNSMNRFPLLLALSLAVPVGCSACETIAVDPVRTTDESALIVWNSKTHLEQFVRRATFESKAKNFGFLVPTPSRPTLSAADDALFPSLQNELEPKRVVKTQRSWDWTPLYAAIPKGLSGSNSDDGQGESPTAPMLSTGAMKSVEVVEQKRVGDYNAVVLRANDSKSLSQWLKKHHYPVSSDTRQWLAPYVRRGFFLTVFQIASDKQSQSAQAQAVRLSFQTDAPFFPYRESKRAQKVGGGRTLRVFFVGDERVGAIIEDGKKSASWPATITYSAPLDAKRLTERKLDVPAGRLRLTAFEDDSSPRPGWGDLKFAPAKEQSEITPPPRIIHKDERHWIPADVLFFGGGALLLVTGFAWRGRRKLQASEA